MRIVQCIQNVASHGVHFFKSERQIIFFQPLFEVRPLDVLHDQKTPAFHLKEICRRNDVRMLQLGLALALVEESFLKIFIPGKLRQKEFNGDTAAELVVTGFPDLRHAAFLDLADEGVLSDFVLWFQGPISNSATWGTFCSETVEDLYSKQSSCVASGRCPLL